MKQIIKNILENKDQSVHLHFFPFYMYMYTTIYMCGPDTVRRLQWPPLQEHMHL